jgi:hypothetical protein
VVLVVDVEVVVVGLAVVVVVVLVLVVEVVDVVVVVGSVITPFILQQFELTKYLPSKLNNTLYKGAPL